MKQILHSLALCGSLLALASCAATDPTEEPGNDPEAGNVTLTATLERSADTRTGHKEDYDGPGVVVSWASGDAIKIVYGKDRTESATFAFTGFEGSSESGIFSGKAEPGASSSGYYALYPATTTFNAKGDVNFDMTGQTQWGDGNMAHLGAYDVMCHYIQTDWKSFTFNESDHVNALMTFALTGIPADLGRPQSITLGCTSKEGSFYNNTSSVNKVPTLQLKLTGFAAPAAGTPVDIKAYLMMVETSIPAGESLIITVKGEKNSYTFTAPPMTQKMTYEAGKRYTATVGAGDWTIVRASTTYTGAETAIPFTGDGSAAKPHEIANAGQLRTLIDEVGKENAYEGTYFKLTTDIRIDMAKTTENEDGFWTPIGVEDYFSGHFDGNGHTISGTMTGTADNFGFFGYTEGATITNLTVDATVSGGEFVGGIVGTASITTRISNCINKGAVTAENGYGGGIAGYASGSSIIACYNTAAVTAADYVGGIAGALGNSSIVTACYNTGKIARAGNETTNIGAIAGENSARSTVSYCQWVLDAANTGLLAFPSGTGTGTKNTVRANLTTLNAAGVTALNAGIKAWNATNAAGTAAHCPFHFVAGTAPAGPVLKAGVPPSTSGGVDDIEPGSVALPQ